MTIAVPCHETLKNNGRSWKMLSKQNTVKCKEQVGRTTIDA